jgi:hypothetical protein
MKLKLNPEETAALLPHIHSVLATGEPWTDETLHHPAEAIISTLLQIRGLRRACSPEAKNGFSTNGWEYDWCQEVLYKKKKYILLGSGFYGGHSFERSE